jgi:hypothetical protein
MEFRPLLSGLPKQGDESIQFFPISKQETAHLPAVTSLCDSSSTLFANREIAE